MQKKRRRRWLGGYVYKAKDGRLTYWLERWHHGRRVHKNTGCATLEGALAELARFEADPDRYKPGGGAAPGLRLSLELCEAYHAHQLAQGLTEEWAGEVSRCLADWLIALDGRDLRRLSLHGDLHPALATWPTQRPHRIKAIKGLFRYLREVRGLVDRNQDPTLDLRVPQARPEKHRRRKVVPPEDVAAVLKHLPPTTRDILHLLTATAWHVSEVRRFAEGGETTRPLKGDALAVLIVRHKSGELHRTSILYPEHLAAAERIRALGRFPKRMTLARHMRAACAAAGVPWFGLGQMRHSVITWAVEQGASTQEAADFAGHRSPQTTRRFYLDVETPKPLPILRLV